MEGPERRRNRSSTAQIGAHLAAIPVPQAHGIIACDFFAVDTAVLKRIYVLVFIEHGTRLLHLAGVTANPTGTWVTQQARNLAMELVEGMGSLRFLIRDRDTKFVAAFDEVFRADGVRIIKTPPQAPRANAICERVVGTLRREVPGQMLIFSEKHLSKILTEYVEHYNDHRPHQSRGQRPRHRRNHGHVADYRRR